MSSQWFNSKPANADQVPVVTSILRDFSAEALGELRTWLEQNPPSISVQNIIGYNTNTVRIYKKAASVLDVKNTTTETPVIDEQIPGGEMGTTGIVRFSVYADYLNFTGSNRTITVKIKFGGTTIYQDATTTGSIATRAAIRLTGEIANTGATNMQFMSGEWFRSNTTAPTTGIGSISNSGGAAEVSPFATNGSVAIDTSIAQPLQVTVTHPVADANLSFRRQFYMVEFL